MGLRWFAKGAEPAEAERAPTNSRLTGKGRRRPFRFELGWSGVFGLAVVVFCLFLWMFLLGLWAGQTILLPPRSVARVTGEVSPPSPPLTGTPGERIVPSAGKNSQGE